MIVKGKFDDGFTWTPSICECKCDKSCDVGKYLDYANCKCRKRLIDKLVDKCDEDIDRNKMVYNATLNDYENIMSCALYIVFLIIAFIIIMGISSVYCYFYWCSKKTMCQYCLINVVD